MQGTRFTDLRTEVGEEERDVPENKNKSAAGRRCKQKLDEKGRRCEFLGQHNRREEKVQDPSEMSWNTAGQVVAGREELVAGCEAFVGCWRCGA